MAVAKCFSLLLGARNTPAAGKHFTSADDEQIRSLTFRHFPAGFTILNASGGWFDPTQKRFVEEDSRQILVCTSDVGSLQPWLDDLAGALQQKELLVIELGKPVTYRVQATATRKKRRVRSTRK